MARSCKSHWRNFSSSHIASFEFHLLWFIHVHGARSMFTRSSLINQARVADASSFYMSGMLNDPGSIDTSRKIETGIETHFYGFDIATRWVDWGTHWTSQKKLLWDIIRYAICSSCGRWCWLLYHLSGQTLYESKWAWWGAVLISCNMKTWIVDEFRNAAEEPWRTQ